MTRLIEDDITGQQYETHEDMDEFGLVAFGDLFDRIETHPDVVAEDPDRVASELHDMVDEWVEDLVEHQATDHDNDQEIV